mmetsp:Transcript_5519/g.5661  ORF Transcript_5519/g.5661 Transcript_5519/m.5661 type:complete len:545 (-) Transcript_5519:93-1727(-)
MIQSIIAKDNSGEQNITPSPNRRETNKKKDLRKTLLNFGGGKKQRNQQKQQEFLASENADDRFGNLFGNNFNFEKKEKNKKQTIINRDLLDNGIVDGSISANKLLNSSFDGFGQKLGKISDFIFNKETNLFTGVNFETTKYVEFLYSKSIINNILQCIFACFSILSGFVQYELESSDKDAKYFLLAEYICFIMSVGLWMTFFFDYWIRCERSFYIEKLPEKLWRSDPELLKKLFFNFIIFFLHPNPVFHQTKISIYNQKFEVSQEIPLNGFMFAICLLRLWFIFKIVIVSSEYSSARTARVCQMNNFNVNFSFALKGLMINVPYRVYGCLMFLCIIYCSYTLRIFERGLDEYSGLDFDNIINSAWCIIITMTTVGFGDKYPNSGFGRMIGIISCFSGLFLVSMLVVTITNTLNLAPHEENIYTILEKVHLESERLDISRDLIAKYFNLVRLSKKEMKKTFDADNEKLRTKKYDFLYTYHKFLEINTEIEATYPPIDNFDIANGNLQDIDENLKKFEGQQKNVMETLGLICKKLDIESELVAGES